MAREFYSIYFQIMDLVHDEKLRNDLYTKMLFWPPEGDWTALSNWVNSNIVKDSSNPASIGIYAILCNCSKEETKNRFKSDGF